MKVHKTSGGLAMETQPLAKGLPPWRSVTITNHPKKNLTDEEIEAWAAQVFENLMSNIDTDEAEEDEEE